MEIVIQIVALRALILGFENIGVVDFRRNLQFGLDFRYGVFRRLSLFVIALGIAFAPARLTGRLPSRRRYLRC